MSGREVQDETATPDQVSIVVKGGFWGSKTIHPSKVYVSSDAMPIEGKTFNLQYVEEDLAILEFAQPISTVTRPVASQPAMQGTEIEVVGFGNHGIPQGIGSGLPKYTGRNSITMAEFDSYTIVGSDAVCTNPKGHDDDWATCGGDSGGPLINVATGEVIGVTSSGGPHKTSINDNSHRQISIFTDVTTPQSQSFIRSVIGKKREPEGRACPRRDRLERAGLHRHRCSGGTSTVITPCSAC